MAKFKLSNVELKTVPAGKQNAGKKYLLADLINTNCVWEAGQRYTCFLEPVVKMFEQWLPTAKGGTAATEQQIPDDFLYITGCFAEYTPPQKFYKEHLSDHPATNGRPAIKAGDLVAKGGVPIIYEKLRVFCMYYMDETSQKQWIRGMEPAEAGMRAFTTYCRPINEEPIASIENPPAEAHSDGTTPKSAPEVAEATGLPKAPEGFKYAFGDDGKTPQLIPA